MRLKNKDLYLPVLPKTLVLFSSAREQGFTYQLVAAVEQHLQQTHHKPLGESFEVVRLDQLAITPYNYENQYPIDDFYTLANKINDAHNLVFASPVYWSSVTANMKLLVDRITEFTEADGLKHIGKGLKEKRSFYLTTSAQQQASPNFHGFFTDLFNYFDMHFINALHVDCRQGFQKDQHLDDIALFTESLAVTATESPKINRL